jgi:hypothetical protein
MIYMLHTYRTMASVYDKVKYFTETVLSVLRGRILVNKLMNNTNWCVWNGVISQEIKIVQKFQTVLTFCLI